MFIKIKSDRFNDPIYEVKEQRGAGVNKEYKITVPYYGSLAEDVQVPPPHYYHNGHRHIEMVYIGDMKKTHHVGKKGFWVKANQCVRDEEVLKLEVQHRKGNRK